MLPSRNGSNWLRAGISRSLLLTSGQKPLQHYRPFRRRLFLRKADRLGLPDVASNRPAIDAPSLGDTADRVVVPAAQDLVNVHDSFRTVCHKCLVSWCVDGITHRRNEASGFTPKGWGTLVALDSRGSARRQAPHDEFHSGRDVWRTVEEQDAPFKPVLVYPSVIAIQFPPCSTTLIQIMPLLQLAIYARPSVSFGYPHAAWSCQSLLHVHRKARLKGRAFPSSAQPHCMQRPTRHILSFCEQRRVFHTRLTGVNSLVTIWQPGGKGIVSPDLSGCSLARLNLQAA